MVAVMKVQTNVVVNSNPEKYPIFQNEVTKPCIVDDLAWGPLKLIMLLSVSKKTREKGTFLCMVAVRRPRLGYQFHENLGKNGMLFSSLISAFN